MNKKTLAKIIRMTVAVLSGILGALLVVYSFYVLWDTYYINKKAFSSTDLTQYKPQIDEETHTIDFNELLSANENAIGWITIFDTNIDYPVMKSVDDNDYINKDLYGNFSLSGSIYLSYKNAADFHDFYNVIYGHHMDSGAMFGGIDNYMDREYFDEHVSGVLISTSQVYDVTIFACVETNAYEDAVYDVLGRNIAGMDGLSDYILTHAIVSDSFRLDEMEKILVMSTCSDYQTNGRLALFASLTPRTTPYVPAEPEKPEKTIDAPAVKGHEDPYKGKSWSLISLLCVLFTIYLFLPLHCLKEKISVVRFNLQPPKLKIVLGIVGEGIVALLSFVLFLILNTFKAPLVLVNGTTILFILLLGIAIGVDVFFSQVSEKK